MGSTVGRLVGLECSWILSGHWKDMTASSTLFRAVLEQKSVCASTAESSDSRPTTMCMNRCGSYHPWEGCCLVTGWGPWTWTMAERSWN